MACLWALACMLAVLIRNTDGSHFRGAMIYWKESPTDAKVIDLDYRQAWRRTSLNPYCTDTEKANGTLFTQGNLKTASKSKFLDGRYDVAVPFHFQCTDYSISEDWTSGKGRWNFTPSAIDSSTNIFFTKFDGCCWIGSINDMFGGSGWSLLVVINTTIRSDTGRMNQSPRVDMAPIVRLQYGCNHTIRIPVSDVDGDDIRCRWAESSIGYDECGAACGIFRNATIDEAACVITYGAFFKRGWYAVSVQIEDFSSKTSNTVLSSIPLQFLVSVENKTGGCEAYEKEKPTFVGLTLPDKACIGVKNSDDFTTDIYIDSKNSSITELETVSPIGLVKSSLEQVNASGTWHISVKWNPNNTDSVNNVFCFTAVNTDGLSSEQRCVTLLAGVPPAEILTSSMTPAGSTVSKDQHEWSVEFDQFANPASQSAYIYLYLADGTLIETINAYNDSGVTLTNGSHGTVLHYHTTTALQDGLEYYFLFGQGLVQGLVYCGAESAAMLEPSFWRFTAGTVHTGPATVICMRDSVEVPCTKEDFNCTDSDSGRWTFHNPCIEADLLNGMIKFPHPDSADKFILCDLKRKAYVVYCPPGEIFYASCAECVAPDDDTMLNCDTHVDKPVDWTNPCTRENILAVLEHAHNVKYEEEKYGSETVITSIAYSRPDVQGKLFWPHPHNVSKFIHCDIWGRPWEQDCPPGEIWDQYDLTCIVPTDVNPCKEHGDIAQAFWPHCDPHKFIHCDALGQSFVQSCQLDYVFYLAAFTCVPPGSYPGTDNMPNTCK